MSQQPKQRKASTASLLRAAMDARPETDTRPWSEFAQEFAEQQGLASVGSVQVQISRILRERGAVEPRRPRPQGDRVPPRLTPLTEALLAASGAGSLEAALDIATTGIEPPSDTAIALAAAIVARADTDAALAKRLATARRQLGKSRA
ncbi:MAG: hypothetical protein NTX95_10010 [Actinobacteria bacterium]|nr:hypothetical protein [Actinomycetota bacterium]